MNHLLCRFPVIIFLLLSFYSNIKAQLPLHLKTASLYGIDLYSTLMIPTKDNSALVFSNPDPHNFITTWYSGSNSILKLDSNGNLIWARTYQFFPPSQRQMSRFIDACVNHDSTFTAVGMTSDTANNVPIEFGNGFCIKFKANGDTLWCKRFEDSSFPTLHPLSISSTSDSGYVISGMGITPINAPGPCENTFFAKINKSGTLEWLNTDVGLISNAGFQIKETPDSGFVVIGGIDTYTMGTGTVIWKLDRWGKIIWIKKYCPVTGPCGIGLDLTVVADGFICLTNSKALSLLKTDFAGNFVWARTLDYNTGRRDPIRYFKLTKLANSDLLISDRAGGPSIITNSSGQVRWAVSNNYMASSEGVQLKNKRFIFITNEPFYLVKPTDSLVPGDLEIIITDSMCSGNARCYSTYTLSSKVTTFTDTSINFTFQPNGWLAPLYPTISNATVVINNGCVALPTSVVEFEKMDVHLFPNPTTDHVILQSEELLGYLVRFELHNIYGKKVLSTEFVINESKTMIKLGTLPSSSYFYTLKAGNDFVNKGKIIVIN